jgi:fumarate hydratase class I
MWVIRVEDFPAVVTMDSHGNSIHDDIEELSRKKYDELLEK